MKYFKGKAGEILQYATQLFNFAIAECRPRLVLSPLRLIGCVQVWLRSNSYQIEIKRY